MPALVAGSVVEDLHRLTRAAAEVSDRT